MDPERTSVERRAITLPLAGKVVLSVIAPRDEVERPDTQPVASPLDPMDLLEHAVRTYEEFMGVGFPESDVVLFVADLIPGGAYGHGLIASNSASDAYTIANGTAYIWDVTPNWLVGSTRWIITGAAEFLTDISERDRLDGPLTEPESSCSLGNNIADLVRPATTFWGEESSGSSTMAWGIPPSVKDSAICI